VKALLLVVAAGVLHAETGYDAWLRYAPLASPPRLPAVVTMLDDSAVVKSAQAEIVRGIRGMTGRTLRMASGPPLEDAIVLRVDAAAAADSYLLRDTTISRHKCIEIVGQPSTTVL